MVSLDQTVHIHQLVRMVKTKTHCPIAPVQLINMLLPLPYGRAKTLRERLTKLS